MVSVVVNNMFKWLKRIFKRKKNKRKKEGEDMLETSLSDYLLSSENKQELINRLIQVDLFLKYLHHNKKMYIFSFDPDSITLYNGQLTMQSFHDKVNYLNEYYKGTEYYDQNGGFKNDINAIADDIEELSAAGVCAFNKMKIATSKQMRAYLKENLTLFNANGQIPSEVYEYYEDIFVNGNIEYLSDFLQKVMQEKAGNDKNNKKGRIYSYSTAAGRALSEKNEENAAFISVLIIPSIMVLIYLVIIVIAMIIK